MASRDVDVSDTHKMLRVRNMGAQRRSTWLGETSTATKCRYSYGSMRKKPRRCACVDGLYKPRSVSKRPSAWREWQVVLPPKPREMPIVGRLHDTLAYILAASLTPFESHLLGVEDSVAAKRAENQNYLSVLKVESVGCAICFCLPSTSAHPLSEM